MVLCSIGIGLGAKMTMNQKLKEETYRYIITETGGPLSADPLEADNARNLWVARMIYTTPVEINPTGSLSSRVLESFVYEPSTAQMTWKLRKGVKFQDQTPVTPFDVALSVTRMAKARPKFPVIESIVGLEDWLKLNSLETLPAGISISGDTITLKFSKVHEHPLFRFSLEIFSIIPSRCIDLKSAEITCDKIPGSGYYKIIGRSDARIDFELAEDIYIHDQPVPRHIHFEYLKPSEVLRNGSSFDRNTVIAGNESRFLPAVLQEMEDKLDLKYFPSARINFILLSPVVKAFEDKVCRRVFADAYRSAFAKVRLQKNYESSLVTEILPGYLASKDLEAQLPISYAARQRCIEQLKSETLTWSTVTAEDDPSQLAIIEQTLKDLGITDHRAVALANRTEEFKAFAEGKVAFLTVGTGFWALEPAGDIQMLFTPKMHLPLQFAAADIKTQELIQNLKIDKDPNGAYRRLNEYVYDQALFNVFAHSRRFFASPNRDLVAELPLSITAPSPWQAFRVPE